MGERFSLDEPDFLRELRHPKPNYSSVFNMDESSDGRQKGNNDKMIPSYYLVGLFLWLALMAYTTSVIDDAMPAVLTEKDAGLTRFSEERGWKWLRRIVGSGPRVAGTKYHLEKTHDLKSLLEEIRGNNKRVKVDWQMVSGDFWLDYRRPYVSAYKNVSNIIAILEGKSGFNNNGTTNSSVLFNCHYDSVPTSPGASDNALFCATMVEVLYILSRSSKTFKHNIIFLFNGAEENPLQGSQGFLKHPWSHGVTALINLDSAGMNCKSMMFQVSDPRVARAYARAVPAPSAQAFGEVLFLSGLVPSDTDFRIFRDFGMIHGIDIAFSKQGHVYHTRHDSLKQLGDGVVQHSGNMLLALAESMADDDQFYVKNTVPSTAVYWDYLNIVMFTYGFTAALFVDLSIIIFAIASVCYYLWTVGLRWSTTKELLIAVLGRLLSFIAGVVTTCIVTVCMVYTTPQLRYLSHSWIVVPLFWLPFIISSVAFSQEYDTWRSSKCGLNRARRVAQATAATRTILIILTSIVIFIPNSATTRYIVTIPLLLSSIASVISLSLVTWRKFQGWQHLSLELLLATPALLMYFVFSVKVNTLMLPIMGRSPADTPDYTVACLNVLCAVLASLPLSGIELLFSRRGKWVVLLSCSLACLAVCFIPLSPYRESDTYPVLQRHYWFHSEIRRFDRNHQLTSQRRSGILFGRSDVHAAAAVRQLSRRAAAAVADLSCDNTTLFCGLPTLFPNSAENAPKSQWADFPPPRACACELKLVERDCLGRQCLLKFSIIGPPHISIAIVPVNSNLTSWSLSTPVKPSLSHRDIPVYFIFWTRGTYSDTLEAIDFSLTFQVTEENSTFPVVQMSFNTHRLSHEDEFTPSYIKLLDLMPEYSNVATTLSTRFDYVF